MKTINTTLSDLIIFSYDLHPKQITGAPSWAESDKFDVPGRRDTAGQASNAQQKKMFQKLLSRPSAKTRTAPPPFTKLPTIWSKSSIPTVVERLAGVQRKRDGAA